MNMEEKNNYSFGELILMAIDGAITEEQFACLEKQLSGDPELQRYYYDFLAAYIALSPYEGSALSSLQETTDQRAVFDRLLEQLGQAEKYAETVVVEEVEEKQTSVVAVDHAAGEKRVRRVSKISLWTAILSTAVLVLMLVFVQMNPRGPARIPVAVLDDTIGARWGRDEEQMTKGRELLQGHLQLTQGLASIVFDEGADVILHAPCAVDLESPNQIFLSRGRVSAKVPRRALGFTVRTPGAKVVDYGTEFGVSVDEAGCTEAHVFKGAVELYAQNEPDGRGGRVLRMYENNAGRADARGNLSMIDIRRTEFVEYSAFSLKKGLVAYWPFDGDALDYSGCGKDGMATGGGQYVSGRIGQAFDFGVYGRYVHIGAADIAVPWTMSAWVKRHSSGSEIPLMISQDYNIRLQQWGSSDGKVGITATGVRNYTFNYVCPLGEWVHLVLAGSKAGTSLYVNGAPVDSIPETIPCPMTSIGRPTPIAASVDDVAVWNRKLTEAEIGYIYRFGLSAVQQRQQ